MNKEKIKLRATWTVEYWADPDNYPDAKSPEEMAAMDERAEWPQEILDHEHSVFTVQVVEDEK